MGPDQDISGHAGHDMSGHAGHDMSGHAGHDMSGHAGHDMSAQDAHQGHAMDGTSVHGDHSPFVYMSGGHGDGVLQAGLQEVLLFPGATTTSPATLALACAVLLLLAVLLEYLRLLAWWLESRYVRCSGGRRDDGDAITACNGKKTASPATNSSSAGDNSTRTTSLVSWSALALLHVVSYVWSTCLMLITMTFNIYLILAIAVGVSAGKLATMHTRSRLTASNKS